MGAVQPVEDVIEMAKNNQSMAAMRSSDRKPEEGIWETVKVVIQALLIAFVVRTFFFQPFNIPSSSMYPTLLVGDYLFVSKLSYGYGKYSFNFSFGLFSDPWVKCCPVDFAGRKVFAEPPERGDVAVFKYPPDTNVDYIKRVIGLPGDRIQMREGVLYINGVPVKKVRVEDFVDDEGQATNSNVGGTVPQYIETLPNNVSYRVLDSTPNGAVDTTQEYVVPEGHYFMMGDNRDNSSDSRYPDKVGFVPIENFMGRADVIFFSVSPDTSIWQVWKLPFSIRWTRFFNLI